MSSVTPIEAFDLTRPNEHYLQHVADLARTHEVVTQEDIRDSSGIKLIAKGSRIDHTLQERLIRFKLSQPLEASLAVHDGFTPARLLAEVETLIERIPVLHRLLDSGGIRSDVLATLGGVQFGRSGALLASITAVQPGASHHIALAVALSLGIGARLGFDPGQLQQIAMAALLHDAGELYINPAYRQGGRALTPEEWRHLAAHPRIGQLVVEGTTSLPKAVSTAIAEHHERANGFGYPSMRGGEDISPIGGILLVAEMLCGVFSREYNMQERACLAVKVIPGEYPAEIVSLLATLLPHSRPEGMDPRSGRTAEVLQRASRILAALTDTLAQVSGQPLAPGGAGRLQERIKDRALMLQGALHATGISECLMAGSLSHADMAVLALEIETVVFEIEWRVRELARQVALSAWGLADGSSSEFGPIISALSIPDQSPVAPTPAESHPLADMANACLAAVHSGLDDIEHALEMPVPDFVPYTGCVAR